jgi:hypothetical protein
MEIFWDVAPYNLADIYRRLKEAYCPRHQHNESNLK